MLREVGDGYAMRAEVDARSDEQRVHGLAKRSRRGQRLQRRVDRLAVRMLDQDQDH